MKAAERPLNERENAAWRAFYEMQELLRTRLEHHLQADSGLSNADYTVLVVLSEVPQGQQRAYELSRRLMWEKSRLHHQLTRMCGRGLVERLNGDGRAVYVAITPEGRARSRRRYLPTAGTSGTCSSIASPPNRSTSSPTSPARSSTASTRPDADGGGCIGPSHDRRLHRTPSSSRREGRPGRRARRLVRVRIADVGLRGLGDDVRALPARSRA